MFGTTALGGDASSDGTVFELVENGASYIFLPPLAFNGANGSNPSGGLITDSNGDFFGVANAGGANGDGTVFEFAKTGASYTLKALASFTGANGTGPEGNLIADANGDLFGATVSGGAGNKGTVFELVKSGATYTLNDIAAFNGANGDTPLGSLIADANGDLFGATLMGGTSNKGTVFELVKTASGYTLVTLVSFTGGADGGNPQGGLIIDANGDLFGVTGGGNNQGTVFELANGASGYKLSTLLSFTGGADGGFPLGSLLADANGDLFGATAGGGGSNNGTVFEIVNSPFLSSAIKVVHNLNSSQDLLVYELYQAAYARIPDNGGFLYWAGVADSQHTSALRTRRRLSQRAGIHSEIWRQPEQYGLRHGIIHQRAWPRAGYRGPQLLDRPGQRRPAARPAAGRLRYLGGKCQPHREPRRKRFLDDVIDLRGGPLNPHESHSRASRGRARITQADRVETLRREKKPPFSGWRRRVFAPPLKISLFALPKAFRGELKRHFGSHRRTNGLLPQVRAALINCSTPRILMALRML